MSIHSKQSTDSVRSLSKSNDILTAIEKSTLTAIRIQGPQKIKPLEKANKTGDSSWEGVHYCSPSTQTKMRRLWSPGA
jgi:hypothetical protein